MTTHAPDPGVHEALQRAMLKSFNEKPIDMVLHCPACGLQHIDEPEYNSERQDSYPAFGEDPAVSWDNPPHRSHLCKGCGHIWRPADVPTNGVAAVTTKGKNDSPVMGSRALSVEEARAMLRLATVLAKRLQGTLQRMGEAMEQETAQAEKEIVTGWPPGMLQDDSAELSRWLAGKPDARLHAREAAALVGHNNDEAHTFLRNVQAYREALPDLRNHSEGKHVVFFDGKHQHTCDTYEEALAYGYEKFGLAQFLVQKVAPLNTLRAYPQVHQPAPAQEPQQRACAACGDARIVTTTNTHCRVCSADLTTGIAQEPQQPAASDTREALATKLHEAHDLSLDGEHSSVRGILLEVANALARSETVNCT